MFFTLGLTGFLFACLAPGYIAVTAFKLQSRLPPFSGPFAISLIANNLLAEALVACGLYNHAIMTPLAFATVLVAATLLLFDKRLTLAHLAAQVRTAGTALANFAGNRRTSAQSWMACFLGLLVILAAVGLASQFERSAILGYDPLASWNRWAIDWAANIFPKYIGHYPQLLPVLLSVPYVVAGHSDVQYFSSSFKILFWLFSFETLAFVALKRRDVFLLFSIPFLYFVFHEWVGATSLEDYADVPVSFFALLSVAAVIICDQDDDAKSVALGLLFASGAAMTKQVGLYMLVATPTLAVAWSYERRRTFVSVRRAAASLLLPEFLAVIAAAPMYIYAIITIRNGTNASELSYILNDQFNGLGYVARMHVGFARLFNGLFWTNIYSAFIFAAGFAALRNRIFRWVFLVIALPFTLLWAANFSYDSRNLALATPFWALCAAASLPQFVKPLRQFLPPAWTMLEAKFGRRTYIVPALLIIAIVGLDVLKGEKFSYPYLLTEQYKIERERLGDRPECTEKMISLLQTLPADHITLSEWRWACRFHFNNDNNCTRIFPQDLFTDKNALSRYAGRNLLIILNRSSLTPAVQAALQNARMTPAGDAQCDEAASLFVRHSN